MKEVQADATMDEKLRAEVLDIYAQAKAQLVTTQAMATKVQALEQSAREAPAQALALKQAATQPTSQPTTADADKIALADMEIQLKKMGLELTELKNKADSASQSLKALTKRQVELPADIAKVRADLAGLAEKSAVVKASADPEPLKRAQAALNMATRQALEARIKLLETTLSTSDAIGGLMRAQQDYFARQIPQLQARIASWQAVVDKRREAEAKRQEQEARDKLRQAAGKHSVVLAVSKYNVYLTQLRNGPEGLNAARQSTAQEQLKVNDRLTKVGDAFDKARQMVDEFGQADVIGLSLRNERAQLPDIRQLRRRSQQRQEKMARVRLLLFQLNEKSLETSDVHRRADQLIESADPPIAPEYKDDINKALVEALADTRKHLDSLITDEQKYISELLNLQTAENRLIKRVEEFRSYIDSKVLWTRSAPQLAPNDFLRSGRAMAWFVSPENWRSLGQTMIGSVRQSPVSAAIGILAVVLLVLLRGRLLGKVRRLGKFANQYGSGAMLRTFQALVLTVLFASAWPAAGLLAGLALTYGGQEESFSFAVGCGLMMAAGVWLPLAVVVGICRKDGLGERYFHWPTEALRRKVRSIRVLMAIELPLVFIVAALQYQAVAEYRESAGRIACILALLVLTAYIAWVFWMGGPMVRDVLGRRKSAWLYRLRTAWYPLSVLVPLWLAGSAVMGYYYTTIQLSSRLMAQLWIIIALVVLQSLLKRWFTIGASRLARAKQSAPPAGDQAGREAGVSKEDQLPTVSEATAQVRQFSDYLMAALTVVTVWLVWADVLPALGVIGDIELWTIGSGASAAAVSLADVAMAVVILVLTVIASKNIPGILEVSILRRLHIEPGASYAINALARYVIAVVGFILTAQAIGINWGHVQWLIAAVSVGLGFGLQEIFGNFVSGLILLFERPIRVGDVVTVGDVTGTVTQIRIRATTILDWDRKELVVPNKEFITNRLINWTLTDTILRVVLPVGIAYGSDTKLARKLLLKVASGHPKVLRDPQPSAFFLGFGDSSLNFELRVFIDSILHLLDVRNDLHMAIDDAFRGAGIEIAFPQQDIHIRSIDAAIPIENRSKMPREDLEV